MRGEHEYAMDLTEESMSLAQALNSRPLIADAQMLGASVALRVGNFEQCKEQLKECLIYYRQAGNRASIPVCLLMSAELTLASIVAQEASRLAALERAARLLGAVSILQDVTGAAMLHADRDNLEAVLASVKAQLSEVAFRIASDEGRAMTIEQAIDYALEGTN